MINILIFLFKYSLVHLGYRQCNYDEYPLSSKCIKIFQQKQTWNNARKKCLSISSRLISLNDVVQEKKLAHFLATIYDRQQSISFWISDENNKNNGRNKKVSQSK